MSTGQNREQSMMCKNPGYDFCDSRDRIALDIKLSKIDTHLEIHRTDAAEAVEIPKQWSQDLLWDSVYPTQFLFRSNACMQQIS